MNPQRIAVLGALLLYCAPAAAQRANEDVLGAAQDAFGTTVGQESIGVYNANEARGFSPIRAGNIRIEGLFVQGSGITGGIGAITNIMSQTSVRVGMSAQSYPFPSPTGIVDYKLRIPGDRQVVSVIGRVGPYESLTGSVNAEIPVVPERFSLGVNIYGGVVETDWGTKTETIALAGIGNLMFGENVQVTPFWSRSYSYDRAFAPMIFMATPGFPPKYDRGEFFGEDWFVNSPVETEYGAVSTANFGPWQMRIGGFRSVNERDGLATHSYFNTRPDGSTRRVVNVFSGLAVPHNATSGEARLSRTFVEGDRRHTFNINVRGRLTERRSGGGMAVDTRPTVIGVRSPVPEPTDYSGSSYNIEKIRQGSLGLSYEGQWREVGEFAVGAQRVSYRRTSINPDSVLTTKPWLYYASAAGYLSDRLAVYGSYTRGLEDSPFAPASATNSTQGVAATISKQIDAGFRYSFSPSAKIIAGVFDIEKPFFGLDDTFFYRELGSIRHQGAELSLNGQLAPGLTVVAGGVLLKARLSGELLSRGRVPAGSVPFSAFVNLQYAPKSWRGFSIDGRVEYDDAYLADSANTFRAPAVTLVDLGARYRFVVWDSSAALRLQLQNLFDVYEWRVTGTLFQVEPIPRRRITLQLTVDF